MSVRNEINPLFDDGSDQIINRRRSSEDKECIVEE